MSLHDVIEKIRKLRALAASTNANEAANAAAAADALIQAHRLAEAQIETSANEAPPERATEATEPVAVWGKRIPSWQNTLLNVLVRQYGCAWFYQWDERPSRTASGNAYTESVQVARVFGRPSDIETIRFMYAQLSLVIVRLVNLNGAGKGLAWRSSYCAGAVSGIREAMWQTERKARAVVSSEALVLIDQRRQDARAALQATGVKLCSGSGGGVSNAVAHAMGKADGRALSNRIALPANAGARQLVGAGS